MKEIKIVHILNNYGEERYIIKYCTREKHWFFGLWYVDVWYTVTYSNTDDPFFYENYDEALSKAKNLLANSNPKKQRIITTLKEEVVNYEG